MTKLAEYGTFSADESAKVTQIDEAYSNKVRAMVRFVESSAGYEPAGSVARWTDGYYAVRWTDYSGAIQGRRYRDRYEAANHFGRLIHS
jgi:hypothetical protein